MKDFSHHPQYQNSSLSFLILVVDYIQNYYSCFAFLQCLKEGLYWWTGLKAITKVGFLYGN
jgi:hypothetical protein